MNNTIMGSPLSTWSESEQDHCLFWQYQLKKWLSARRCHRQSALLDSEKVAVCGHSTSTWKLHRKLACDDGGVIRCHGVSLWLQHSMDDEVSTSKLHVENANRSVWLLKVRDFATVQSCCKHCLSTGFIHAVMMQQGVCCPQVPSFVAKKWRTDCEKAAKGPSGGAPLELGRVRITKNATQVQYTLDGLPLCCPVLPLHA